MACDGCGLNLSEWETDYGDCCGWCLELGLRYLLAGAEEDQLTGREVDDLLGDIA